MASGATRMNMRVPVESIIGKTCLRCYVNKEASAFKLHSSRYVRKSGEVAVYRGLDNTCKRCRWDAVRDRVNAARRKGGCAGERNSQAILTQDWVVFIRSRTGRRIQNVKLASWAGVSPAAIHLCKSNKSWNF